LHFTIAGTLRGVGNYLCETWDAVAMTDSDANTRADDAPPTASKTAKPDRALVSEAVTIARPASELYAFWRNPANLVQFMDNVISIEALDDLRSRWTVKAPMGKQSAGIRGHP
jgi:uncharacterized membrane protein